MVQKKRKKLHVYLWYIKMMLSCLSSADRVGNMEHRGVIPIRLYSKFQGTPWNLDALWTLFCSLWLLSPSAAKSHVGECIQTLRWPMRTHAPWLESLMFSRIPLGVQKTLLHGGGVTSCGTYGHQSGQQVIPPTMSSADPLCQRGSRWATSK